LHVLLVGPPASSLVIEARDVLIGGGHRIAPSTVARVTVRADRFDAVIWAAGTNATKRGRDIKRLRRDHPAAWLIAVCDALTDLDVRKLVEAGATGVVEAPNVGHALLATLYAATSGQLCVPDRLMRSLHRPTLSSREKQVLALVVLGLSNGEIASKLFVAESTVKTHLGSAFAKLGVRSRAAATERILDPDSGLGPGILAITSADDTSD
jgi:DNA-binding NarL/FixJ family response regulator